MNRTDRMVTNDKRTTEDRRPVTGEADVDQVVQQEINKNDREQARRARAQTK